VAVPLVRDCRRLVALVAELEAPDSVGLDGRDGEFGFGVLALQGLDEGHAVEDEDILAQGSKSRDLFDDVTVLALKRL